MRTPRADLDTAEAIDTLVRRFYADVAVDDVLGPMFNDVARVDWSEHIPKLAAFWRRALLSRPGYEGNPYRVHQLVHAKRPMTPEHFVRWLELFHDVVDSGWRGPRAEDAKDLARRVADVHCRQIVGRPVPFSPPPVPGRGDPLDEGGEAACWAHLVLVDSEGEPR